MDNSAWHPEDKKWLEQRKPEWRQIQRHLKLFKMHFRGEYLKHHKELFFYGRISPEVEKKNGDDYFAWALPLFIWWYHPEPSPENYQVVIDSQVKASPLVTSRTFLLETFPSADKFDTDYGMFGGREELMVKILVPSCDSSEEKQFSNKHVNRLTGEETIRTTSFPLCLPPNLIARYCLNGILPHILGFRKNPYAPGQYLWGHLCAIVEAVTDESSQKRIRELAVKVLSHETDAGFPKDDSTAVALAKHLKGRYDNRDFSDAMLAIWDEESTKLGAA